MVKQEIYKINDFSCGVEETIYWHKFGHIHTGLSQSEKEKDTKRAIQPEHMAIHRKQYKNHYTTFF